MELLIDLARKSRAKCKNIGSLGHVDKLLPWIMVRIYIWILWISNNIVIVEQELLTQTLVVEIVSQG